MCQLFSHIFLWFGISSGSPWGPVLQSKVTEQLSQFSLGMLPFPQAPGRGLRASWRSFRCHRNGTQGFQRSLDDPNWLRLLVGVLVFKHISVFVICLHSIDGYRLTTHSCSLPCGLNWATDRFLDLHQRKLYYEPPKMSFVIPMQLHYESPKMRFRVGMPKASTTSIRAYPRCR